MQQIGNNDHRARIDASAIFLCEVSAHSLAFDSFITHHGPCRAEQVFHLLCRGHAPCGCGGAFQEESRKWTGTAIGKQFYNKGRR
jgi:hypothetical protein